MQLVILSLIALAESQFDYFYSDGFGSAFGDEADADLGIFVSRNGAATTCTQGTKLDGLPTTVVTCGDGEVCQVLVRYHTHPNGAAKAHYHTRCVKEDVCQSNIKTNTNQCNLHYSGGRSLMAQCAGCCTGNLCNVYGPVFTPATDNVADNSQGKFGTLTMATP